jgi:hypothetical protein
MSSANHPERGYNCVFIDGAQTVQVKTKPGHLYGIFSNAVAGTVQIFDHASASSNQKGELSSTATKGVSAPLRMKTDVGIRIVTAGAGTKWMIIFF